MPKGTQARQGHLHRPADGDTNHTTPRQGSRRWWLWGGWLCNALCSVPSAWVSDWNASLPV